MEPWERRSVEEANLFNPAFCNALIAKTVEGFTRTAGIGLPFPLAFLILPIILHQATRQALPRTTITSLLPWIEANQAALVGFPDRVHRLRPMTQEALIFGLHQSAIAFGDHGSLMLGAKRVVTTKRTMTLFTDETRECVARSIFLGRWFAGAGTPATIMGLWGVTP